MSGHDLVVGGSGMLAGLVMALARDGRNVSVVARDPDRLARLARRSDGIRPLPLDYGDIAALEAALTRTAREHGRIERAVCWIHSPAPEIALAIARHVGSVYCHVLGSAMADPAAPEALAAWRDRFSSLKLDYRIVVLGFVVDPVNGSSRWLTDEEISTGVKAALDGAKPLSIVGTVMPWSKRP